MVYLPGLVCLLFFFFHAYSCSPLQSINTISFSKQHNVLNCFNRTPVQMYLFGMAFFLRSFPL